MLTPSISPFRSMWNGEYWPKLLSWWKYVLCSCFRAFSPGCTLHTAITHVISVLERQRLTHDYAFRVHMRLHHSIIFTCNRDWKLLNDCTCISKTLFISTVWLSWAMCVLLLSQSCPTCCQIWRPLASQSTAGCIMYRLTISSARWKKVA